MAFKLIDNQQSIRYTVQNIAIRNFIKSKLQRKESMPIGIRSTFRWMYGFIVRHMHQHGSLETHRRSFPKLDRVVTFETFASSKLRFIDRPNA
jgi:hypothetical protein